MWTKKCFVLKIYQPFWLCSQLRYKNKMKKKTKQRTFNLFPPYQWKTNSLHIIVKFGVKIDLFSDISLFYRINAFIVFVQIWSFFYLFISIHSSNCHLFCLLNFDVCLKCARLFCLTPRVILSRFLLKSTKNRRFLRSRLPIPQQSSPWLL